MRKLLFLLSLAATMLTSSALTINNTAGGLAVAVNDNTDVTSLVVSGTMDARDFLFITDKMNELTTLDMSQVTITSYNEGRALYGTVTSYPGNAIPRTAFFGKKLTSVTLPEGLETIGFAAFAGCDQLRSITFPATVSMIDDYAFAGSGLTTVALPPTVVYMGKGVFARCEQMTTASVASFILGDFAFLGDVNLSNVVIGAGVNYILKGAFNGCTSLKSINLEQATGLARIDEEAFINSGLESVALPAAGIGTIGDWAFAQTNLSSFLMTDGMTQLGEGALAHNRLLTTVELPGLDIDDNPSGEGVRDQGGRRKASAPIHTLERIKDYTFAGDTLLDASYLIKQDVAYIGNYALYNVSAVMDTMRLPSSVTYLGDYAMAGMTGMSTLKTGAADVPALGVNVWEGVDQQRIPLIVPDEESVARYQAADQWMNFFISVESDFILGDVNGDGYVDINDVTLLINYILTGNDTNIDMRAADMTGDNTIDINDVTVLINSLLTGAASKTYRLSDELRACYAATADRIDLPIVSLRPGETCTVDASLLGDEHNYTAMQFRLILPEGVELVSLTGTGRGADHTFHLLRHEGGENAYEVMGLSLAMAMFGDGDGPVMRLTLAADDSFSTADATIQLVGVLLATPTDAYLSADVTAKMDNGTGVEEVAVSRQVTSVNYINAAGQQSETPFSGINIVVTTYDDGSVTTTKVVK